MPIPEKELKKREDRDLTIPQLRAILLASNKEKALARLDAIIVTATEIFDWTMEDLAQIRESELPAFVERLQEAVARERKDAVPPLMSDA